MQTGLFPVVECAVELCARGMELAGDDTEHDVGTLCIVVRGGEDNCWSAFGLVRARKYGDHYVAGSYIGVGFECGTHGKGGDVVKVFVGPVVAIFECCGTRFRERVEDETGEAKLLARGKIAFYGFVKIGCCMH